MGWVFREHLKGYSHWAFGDLDVFVGDLTKGWLEPEELRNFDIVTYRYDRGARAAWCATTQGVPKEYRVGLA